MAAGYTKMDAYTPLPIEELWEAIGHKSPPAGSWSWAAGSLIGRMVGFMHAVLGRPCTVHYPINVGGRPLNSWPSFIIITFELTILFAAVTAVLGMLALNGLPRPHHPVFDVPEFETASRNRFFLLILGHDPRFDRDLATNHLRELSSVSVSEVPNP